MNSSSINTSAVLALSIEGIIILNQSTHLDLLSVIVVFVTFRTEVPAVIYAKLCLHLALFVLIRAALQSRLRCSSSRMFPHVGGRQKEEMQR